MKTATAQQTQTATAEEVRHTEETSASCPNCQAPRTVTPEQASRELVCDHCSWQFERAYQDKYQFHNFFGLCG